MPFYDLKNIKRSIQTQPGSVFEMSIVLLLPILCRKLVL